MIKLFKIKGDSLFPIYKNGEIVLSLSSKFLSLKENDIVVFKEKNNGLMIKKIKSIHTQQNKKKYFLIGTNAHSIDSRNFGSIDESHISHKVLFKIY